jgi:hypothetical protein
MSGDVFGPAALNALIFNVGCLIRGDLCPKKLIVKPFGFPYQCEQMHRVGAGINRFYPESVCVCTRKMRAL